MTDEGTVHRWSEHTQLEKIVKNWSPRFDVEHDTRTVSLLAANSVESINSVDACFDKREPINNF